MLLGCLGAFRLLKVFELDFYLHGVFVELVGGVVFGFFFAEKNEAFEHV